MSNDKFNSNRNKFRRVYSFGGRPPPNLQTYTDTLTGETRTRDFNQILRDRDYYLINIMTSGAAFVPPIEFGEYEEKTTSYGGFNESLGSTFFFDTPFSQVPFVTVELSGSDPNANAFITEITTVKFVVRFSDIVSPNVPGDVFADTFLTYRAVYAPSYPAIVERKPDFVGVYATASAGITSPVFISGITMSFAPLSGPPEIFTSNIMSFGPDFSDFTMNVGQAVWTLTNAQATAELSVDFSGSVDYIALKTIPPGSPSPVNPDV